MLTLERGPSEIIDAGQKASIERRVSELNDALISASPDVALPIFRDLHGDVDGCFDTLKRRLLGTSLAWTDEEKAAKAWIYRISHRMARTGRRLADALARAFGPADDRVIDIAALAMHYMGESVKCEVAVGRQQPYDYRGLHRLMKMALSVGRERDPHSFVYQRRELTCTLEALYFRALLLAKFSSGNLSSKQIEVLDAGLWAWMPVLRAVREAPPGSAMRADLDSDEGLRNGPRHGTGLPGHSLYLPQAPLEEAYRGVVKELHAGHLVPSEGLASEFRIEEHVAVLEAVRASLREARKDPVARAERNAVDVEVDLFVGLTEIMERAMRNVAPGSASVELILREADANARARAPVDRRDPTNSIYDPVRRRAQWVDASDTGLGLQGAMVECGDILAGDLVGIRRALGAPLIIGKVVRRVPAAGTGRVTLGVSIISSDAQPITVTQKNAKAGESSIDLAYVPGRDDSGRHDAYLVPERLYREAGPFETTVDDNVFTFRFNRMRERGHGWALAGFEVTSRTPVAAHVA